MSSTNQFIETSDPPLSVIVPCYNSERTIQSCLSAILNQRASFPFEVIVVDSSSDETPKIVESEYPSVRLIHLDKRAFAGAARNIGVRASKAPFCLMIDSDCVAEPCLIERAMARHGEGNYAAVGGSLGNGTPKSFSGIVGYLIEFKEFMPTAPKRLVSSAPTANILYRRESLERYGCFDEDMWLAEDILLNWKMSAAGEHILFDPEIKVTHLNRTGFREVLKYQIGLGRMSAVARRRGGLPGKYLLDYPALVALMPFVRTARAAVWLGRYDRKMFLLFMLIWPAYLLAALFWSFGFFGEAISE